MPKVMTIKEDIKFDFSGVCFPISSNNGESLSTGEVINNFKELNSLDLFVKFDDKIRTSPFFITDTGQDRD